MIFRRSILVLLPLLCFVTTVLANTSDWNQPILRPDSSDLLITGRHKYTLLAIEFLKSLTEKQNCWVLEMNKKIVWIVGKRIDERFKLTSKTKNILRISLR